MKRLGFGVVLSVLAVELVFGLAGCQAPGAEDQHPIVALLDMILPDTDAERAEKLRERLASPDADLRRQGVQMLAESPAAGWDSTPKILRIMAQGDSDAQVRAHALAVLARIDSDTALLKEAVTTAAKDPSAHVRLESLQVLETRQPQWGCAILTERLAQDTDVNVRGAAARALSHCRQENVLNRLAGSLNDEFVVSYRARQSLQTLTGQDFGYDEQAWRQWFHSAAEPFTPAAQVKD